MTKEVFIRITGLQIPIGDVEDNDNEPIEVVHTGTYYNKNGKHYVFYEEATEGFQGVTKVQIRWQKDGVLEVIKKGISNSHMVFEKNERHICDYQTPFGSLEIGILTKRIAWEEKEDMLEISVEYNMDVNLETVAKCMIKIDIQPRNTEISLYA